MLESFGPAHHPNAETLAPLRPRQRAPPDHSPGDGAGVRSDPQPHDARPAARLRRERAARGRRERVARLHQRRGPRRRQPGRAAPCARRPRADPRSGPAHRPRHHLDRHRRAGGHDRRSRSAAARASSRRFVAFIDPPSLQLAEAAAPSETVPLPSSRHRLAGRLARRRRPPGRRVAAPAATARRARRRRAAAGAAARRRAAAGRRDGGERPPGAGAEPRRRPRRPTQRAEDADRLAAAPRAGGARLQLDPPRAVAEPRPPRRRRCSPRRQRCGTGALRRRRRARPVAPPRTATDPLLAQVDGRGCGRRRRAACRRGSAEQQLRGRGARMRSESHATQEALATLQARVRQAEQARYRNVLVYILAATTLLGVLVAARAAGGCGRASAGARAGSTPRPTSRRAPPRAAARRPPPGWRRSRRRCRGRRRCRRRCCKPATRPAPLRPASTTVRRLLRREQRLGQPDADDAALVDRRPRGDDRARPRGLALRRSRPSAAARPGRAPPAS